MRFACCLLGLALFLGACGDGAPGEEPARMNTLEQELRALVAEHPEALVAVAVRDPATDTSIDLDADTLVHAASTMKVPVMVEVFRQAEAGRFSLDDSIVVRNAFQSIVDGSPYRIEDDSDDAIYEQLDRPMSVRDLVYQMITVSSNLATNLLIDLVSADSVQQTLERMGGRRMQVLRGVEDLKAYERGLNNTATAADLAVVLEAIMRGEAVSAEASTEMVKILHDQHFNEMIPAGLPEGARAAHKTGWITGINHDAGIVYPEGGEPYVLVILTRGLPDSDAAYALGAEVTRRVHAALRPGARAAEAP